MDVKINIVGLGNNDGAALEGEGGEGRGGRARLVVQFSQSHIDRSGGRHPPPPISVNFSILKALPTDSLVFAKFKIVRPNQFSQN